MQSKKEGEGPPIYAFWNQRWRTREWGNIRGFPQILAYENTEIFLNFLY